MYFAQRKLLVNSTESFRIFCAALALLHVRFAQIHKFQTLIAFLVVLTIPVTSVCPKQAMIALSEQAKVSVNGWEVSMVGQQLTDQRGTGNWVF